jgi:hypothetical protein
MATRNHDHEGMVHFHQMKAACGLASALMVSQPRKNPDIHMLLDTAATILDTSCRDLKAQLNAESSRYQLGAAFILLKLATSDAIGEMLTTLDKTIYEDIQAVMLYEMRARLTTKYKASTTMATILDEFVDSDKLPCKLVEAYATVIKSNVELKLLLAAFGFKPVPFPGSRDGTGALVFPRQGQRGMSKNQNAKDSSMNSKQYDGSSFLLANFDDSAVLAWQGFHWSAVKSINETDGHVDAIYCLDPGSYHARELRLDTRDPGTCLYLFKKDTALLEKLRPLVHALLGISPEEKKE